MRTSLTIALVVLGVAAPTALAHGDRETRTPDCVGESGFTMAFAGCGS